MQKTFVRKFALVAAAAVASAMVLFSPSTASAATCAPKTTGCWHVQINVTSVPTSSAGNAASILVVVNTAGAQQCVPVPRAGSYDARTYVSAGQKITLTWNFGSDCLGSLGQFPNPKEVTVTDPGERTNFWVTMSA